MEQSTRRDITTRREEVQFYSHPAHRQDRWVIEDVFDYKRNGFFVDAGAGPDGIQCSNTYALEAQLGWTGICIEPHPARFAEMQKNRKSSLKNVCLTDRPMTVEFTLNHELPGTSAILEELSEPSRASDYREGEPYDTIRVQGRPLWEILKEEDAPSIIDYLSMDIEGAEHLALKDFPFDQYTFLCMTIERNSRHYLALRRLLMNHGYRLAANYCIDDFYYHPSVAYRPDLSTRLATGARRIANEIYDREPALTARRLGRRLKKRS